MREKTHRKEQGEERGVEDGTQKLERDGGTGDRGALQRHSAPGKGNGGKKHPAAPARSQVSPGRIGARVSPGLSRSDRETRGTPGTGCHAQDAGFRTPLLTRAPASPGPAFRRGPRLRGGACAPPAPQDQPSSPGLPSPYTPGSSQSPAIQQ